MQYSSTKLNKRQLLPQNECARLFSIVLYVRTVSLIQKDIPLPCFPRQIRMWDSSDYKLHASYDSVLVDSTDFTLTSLGNYFGNAGERIGDWVGGIG